MEVMESGDDRRVAPLVVDHGYLIMQLGDVRALIDTGSPISFGDPGEVVVDGVAHPIVDQGAAGPLRAACRLCPAAFDVLLGTDILSHHRFTLDTARGEITFGDLPADGHAEQVGFFMGSPCLTIDVAGRRARCILDTGANIAFLHSDAPWPTPPTGERSDFVPTVGRFVTPVRRCPARLLGREFTLEFGELPHQIASMLAPAGIGGIMGMELLESGRLGFDLASGRVVFDPF